MTRHITIIGGGVIGLCTTYYCIRRGHQVTVIESRSPDGDSCSHGNAGLVVPSHITPLTSPRNIALALRWLRDPAGPFYIRPRPNWDLLTWLVKLLRSANNAHVERASPVLRDLQYASRACFEEIASDGLPEFGFTDKGLLNVCRTQQGLEEEGEFAEHTRRFGIPTEVLTPAEAAKREPNLAMDITGAIYFPDDCHISPDAFIHGLTRQLQDDGATVMYNNEVTGWQSNGNTIDSVETNEGVFSADEFVICSGVWSQDLARNLGLRLPMQAGKGYSLTLSYPPQLPEIGLLLSEARVAVTPMQGRLRFAGTVEIAGRNRDINEHRVQAIRDAALSYLPAFTENDFRDVKPWAGLRPCSPDGLPYIGRVARYQNLSIATGHAMMGVSLGPITGKLIAEILSDEKTSIPIDMLSPDR